MKMVFQQKVQEKESKLKQSEEELYARHREMKDALDKQRLELEDKKRRIESGRPLTPEKGSVRIEISISPKLMVRKSDSVLESKAIPNTSMRSSNCLSIYLSDPLRPFITCTRRSPTPTSSETTLVAFTNFSSLIPRLFSRIGFCQNL